VKIDETKKEKNARNDYLGGKSVAQNGRLEGKTNTDITNNRHGGQNGRRTLCGPTKEENSHVAKVYLRGEDDFASDYGVEGTEGIDNEESGVHDCQGDHIEADG